MLTVVRMAKKFHAFYGTRKFISVFTRSYHWSLSCTTSVQPATWHPVCWRPILILSSQLRLHFSNSLFSSGFPTEIFYASFMTIMHTTCPSHLMFLDLITFKFLGVDYKLWSSSLCSFLHHHLASLSRILISSSAPYSQTTSVCILP